VWNPTQFGALVLTNEEPDLLMSANGSYDLNSTPNPAFGSARSYNPPREVQLGVRFTF
jgi:hypothetical protein